jgi:hypothetical protein
MNRSIFSRITRPFCVTCLSLLMLTFVRPALAGPVDPKHLAADTKWFIHLDFDAAKKTDVYAQALDAVKAQFPLESTLNQLKAGIGVNPLTDITGVTIYNTSFEKDVAALIVYAKVDQDMLQLAVSNNPDYKQVAYGKHTLHTWTDNNDGKTKTGCFYGDGMILMADKVETLKMALDVLDGTKTSGSALVKEPAAGAFLYGAADLALLDDKNVSQLLSNSEAATASISEAEGKVVVSVNLTAKNAATAAQLKKLLDGVQAFGVLQTRDLPTVSELIQSVDIANEGAKIVATFKHDSKTILQTLQKLDEENKEKVRKAAATPAPAK